MDLDQEPMPVIFDWRLFLFHHPVLPLNEQITPLDDPSVFPEIYGLKYDLTSQQSLILLDPYRRSKCMKWFFPLTPRYWTSRSRVLEIYSHELLPADQDVRELLGDQQLACPCKYQSLFALEIMSLAEYHLFT